LSGSGNAYNAVAISGTVGGTEAPATWSWGANPTLPYACASPVIPAGTTLQVAAGAVVKFQTAGFLTLGGTLQSLGTTPSPVWFTSLADDAHGGDSNAFDGAVTLGRGYWYGSRQPELYAAADSPDRLRRAGRLLQHLPGGRATLIDGTAALSVPPPMAPACRARPRPANLVSGNASTGS
jgi:hypothetical protein